MKNKKGNLPITILVFLILILLLTSILTGYFLQRNLFQDYQFIRVQELNFNKIAFEQNLYVMSKIAGIKTFEEFSNGTNYDYIKNRKNTGEFFELHEKLDENFKNRFEENLLEILNLHDSEKEKLVMQYDSIKRKNFDTEINDGKIKLNLTYISVNEQEAALGDSFFSGIPLIGNLFSKEKPNPKIISLNYQTQIEIFLNLERISLESFNTIYSAKEECKKIENLEEIKECFEKKLSNFEVEVENVQDYVDNSQKTFPFESIPNPAEDLKLIKLKTKEYFAFENNLKQIEITFVPR